MIYLVYAALAALQLLAGVHSLVGGVRYLRHFRGYRRDDETDHRPFVSLIAPCRGMDDGLVENLRSLTKLDYSRYEIIFVVDSMDDPAVSAIDQVKNEAKVHVDSPEEHNNRVWVHENDQKVHVKLVMAPRAEHSGQKAANLLAAIDQASPEAEVYAFVDSDARPSAEWLAKLVAPLSDPAVGAATGYRWFAASGSRLASHIRSAWNASIASALGADTRSNFCWGGSMALRRETFERLAIRSAWERTLSDDFALTSACRRAGLGVAFVPGALTLSPGDCSFSQLVEFSTRQMKITRVYDTRLWIISLIGSAMYVTFFLASVILIAVPEVPPSVRWIAAASLLAVSTLTLVKAWLRLRAVETVSAPVNEQGIAAKFIHVALCLFTPLLFLYNSIAAATSRDIRWRGIRYRLNSPTETVIIPD